MTASAFNQERADKILAALRLGASRRTAADMAGVDEASLRRWLAKGEQASSGTRFRRFYDAVLEAEAAPRVRALGIIYREMPDNPMLAWKFLERREPGFGPGAQVEDKPDEPEPTSLIDDLARRRRDISRRTE